MSWFKKREEKNIYILSGVEDFLTESAKKYKRNLMYCTFLILVLSIMKYLEMSQGFNSLLGFKVDKQVPIDFVIGIVSIVCLYEVVMLSSYIKVCKSNWVGRAFDSKEEIEFFKARFEGVKYDLERVEHIFSYIDHIRFSFEQLVESKLLTEWDRMVRDSHNGIKEPTTRLRESLGMYEISNTSIGPEHFEQIKGIYDKNLEQYLNKLDRHLSDIKSHNFGSAEGIREDISKYNEEWKIYIEHQIEKNIREYKGLSERIDLISRPYGTIVWWEMYFPLVIGFVAVVVGFTHAYRFIESLPT